MRFGTHRLASLMLAVAALFGVPFAACGSGDKPEPPPAPTSTASLAPSLPTLTPTARPAASPPASPTAAPSASPSPGATSRADVIAAAERALAARNVPQLTRAACLANNPDRMLCIDLVADDSTVAAGLARFAAGDPDAGNFSVIMGRDGAGQWKFLRGSQQEFYELTALPGQLRVCSEANDTAVHSEPSATSAEVGRLPRLATVEATAFVLTRASALQTPNVKGEGFYRVRGSVAGWIESRATASAALGDCTLHDTVEGTSHG